MTSRAKIAALAFGLSVLSVPAFAADDQHGRDRDNQSPAANQQDQNGQVDQGGHDRNYRAHKDNNSHIQKGRTPPSHTNKADWQNNANTNSGGNDTDRDHRYRGNRGGPNYGSNANNNGRSNFDLSRYRRNFESPRRFRIGVYHAPRGYHYRRWHFGERLPIAFYARDFWLTDFIAFGLFAPPPGCAWVRYGPDALLIDIDTGEIIQVRYDVFYS